MFAIAFQGSVWDFPVRPESLDISYPARITVTPTLRSAYVDHFGPGVGSISISGTTGYGGGSKSHRPNGQKILSQLVQMYGRYLVATRESSNPESLTMTFVDGLAGTSFVVVPDASGLRVSQSKGSPMLRRFTLTMQVIKDLAAPAGTGGTGLALGLAARISGAPSAAVAGAILGASALAAPTVAYQMQVGDTINSVAHMFGVDSALLAVANGLGLPDRVGTGAVVNIGVKK